jgi:DHA2 family multidrug resistance protein
MFKDRNFSLGLIFIFMVGTILLATLALLTPYLQNLMGYPVITAGLVLAPRGVGTMIAMVIVGRVINKVDPRALIVFGLLLTSFALYEMSGFTPDVSQSTLIRTGIVQGFGLGFIFVPLSTITFATLTPEFRTQGTALFSLVRNIGSSIGISLVIFLLGRNTQIMHAELTQYVTPFNDALQRGGAGRIWDLTSAAGRAALNAEITRQATAIAFNDDFKLMMIVALAALPLVLLLRRAAAKPASAAEAVLD